MPVRSSDSTIINFHFDEVVVPAHPGVINSEGLSKPLHMLPVDANAAWSVQFDDLPKLILRMELANGTVGFGEFYRDHEWPRVEAICTSLLGRSVLELPLQDLPMPLCREYDGFERAIWDAYAKLINVSLHRLLGGALRQRVKTPGLATGRSRKLGPGPVATKSRATIVSNSSVTSTTTL
jgi:muconate cycloisomerase